MDKARKAFLNIGSAIRVQYFAKVLYGQELCQVPYHIVIKLLTSKSGFCTRGPCIKKRQKVWPICGGKKERPCVSSFRAWFWPLPDFGHNSWARKSPFAFTGHGFARNLALSFGGNMNQTNQPSSPMALLLTASRLKIGRFLIRSSPGEIYHHFLFLFLIAFRRTDLRQKTTST